MDKLFGTLHTPIKPPHYTGVDTDSIKLTVDNAHRQISAELAAAYVERIHHLEEVLKDLQNNIVRAIGPALDDLKEANDLNSYEISRVESKHDAAVEELEAADKANAEALAALNTKYQAEVDALKVTDTANTEALAKVEADYKAAVEELMELVNQIANSGLTRELVDALPDPENADPNTIYMVKNNSEDQADFYDEYLLVNSRFELLGNTQVDLSNYYTKSESNNNYYTKSESNNLIQLAAAQAQLTYATKTDAADLQSNISDVQNEVTGVKSEITEVKSEITEAKTDISDSIAALENLINSFHPLQFTKAISSSPNICEKGSSANIKSSWTLNRKPQTITANGDTPTNSSQTNGQAAISYTHNWEASAENNKLVVKADSLENTSTITFTYYVYYGVGGDEISLDSLTKKLSTTQAIGNVTVDIEGTDTEPKYFWYAIPTSYNEPTFKVGGFEGGVDKQASTLTRSYGSEEVTYKLYKSAQPNLGKTTFNIS